MRKIAHATLAYLTACLISTAADAVGPFQPPADLGEQVMGGDSILRLQAGGAQGPAGPGAAGALASPFSTSAMVRVDANVRLVSGFGYSMEFYPAFSFPIDEPLSPVCSSVPMPPLAPRPLDDLGQIGVGGKQPPFNSTIPVSAEQIALGQCADAQCTVCASSPDSSQLVPRWAQIPANSSETDALGGDGVTMRVARTSVLNFWSLRELEPDPNQNCTVPREIPLSNWPWARLITTGDGGPRDWAHEPSLYATGAIVGTEQAIPWTSDGSAGLDGPSGYVDPFQFNIGNFHTAYLTTKVTVAGQTPGPGNNRQAVLVSRSGGFPGSWKTASLLDLTSAAFGAASADNGWRMRMTTTPPNALGDRMLFVAVCSAPHLQVAWSYDGGATFAGHMILPHPCFAKEAFSPVPGETAPGRATVAVSRVGGSGLGYENMRVVYPTRYQGKVFLSRYLLTLPSKSNFESSPITQGTGDASALALVPASDDVFPQTGTSIERVSFIEPDAFEWSSVHAGQPLSDIALLAWDEETVGEVGTQSASAHYALAVRDEWTESNPLARTAPGAASDGVEVTWTSKSHAFSAGDYNDGAFYYTPGDDFLNYVPIWQERQRSTNPQALIDKCVTGDPSITVPIPDPVGTMDQHYNVVRVRPRESPSIISMALSADTAATAVVVNATGIGSASTPDPELGLAVLGVDGVWREPEGDCEHPRLTLGPDHGGTFRCTMKHAAASRVIAMLKPKKAPQPAHPPAFLCGAKMRVLCRESSRFSSALACDAASAGTTRQCIAQPVGEPPIAACSALRGACGGDTSCCDGLVCSMGLCEPP